MNILLTIFIFVLVLFLYIYVNNQFKKSQDLDIYEMDYYDNKNLQEVCEVRQPVLFNIYEYVPNVIETFSYETVSNYKSFDIKIKDTNEYHNGSETTVDPVVISLDSGLKLIENDKQKHFLTENNDEFLEESGLAKHLALLDDFLKPTFNIISNYDIITGSSESATPFKYHNNYRRFLCVTSGKIRVKMTPWKNSKYMHPIKDYDSYEFYSPINPIECQSHYLRDFQKTKFLEFDVFPGYVLFIPPYWWYSVQFSDSNKDLICSITYSTLMNTISNAPDLFLHWLQQQNIQQKVSKTPILKNEEQTVQESPVEYKIEEKKEESQTVEQKEK
jgi:hypothetical protein